MKSASSKKPPLEVIYEPYSIVKEMKDFLEDLWDAYRYTKDVQVVPGLNGNQKEKIKGIQKIVMTVVQSYTKNINDLSEYEMEAREEKLCEEMMEVSEQMANLMDQIDRELVCAKWHMIKPFIRKNKFLVQTSAEC